MGGAGPGAVRERGLLRWGSGRRDREPRRGEAVGPAGNSGGPGVQVRRLRQRLGRGGSHLQRPFRCLQGVRAFGEQVRGAAIVQPRRVPRGFVDALAAVELPGGGKFQVLWSVLLTVASWNGHLKTGKVMFFVDIFCEATLCICCLI